jgi:hypothetical protein
MELIGIRLVLYSAASVKVTLVLATSIGSFRFDVLSTVRPKYDDKGNYSDWS